MKRLISLLAALAVFTGTASASALNIIADDRDSMVAAVDDGLRAAFRSGESEVVFTISGEFAAQFKAADDRFEPDEVYFTSNAPLQKFKYTEGNDYIGLKMSRVEWKVSYTYDPQTSAVDAFSVVCRVDKWHETPGETEYVERFARENVASIIADAETEYDKAKNIHDWIVLNYDYAYSDTYNSKSHSAYGMLTNGRGVCSAYTLLFDVLCRAAGLNTRIVFSEKTYAVTSSTFNVHCWNMVEVDGKWYHVDVTWDDQPHLGNGVVYNYFLKSSDYFLKNSHLWDDREDGLGTPYPEAKRNHWDVPGASGSDNITRPIEGEKPKVVERVTGLESSVPEPVELEDSSSAPEPPASSASSEGAGGVSSLSPLLFVIAGAVFCAAVAVVAVIIAKRGKRSAPPEEKPASAPKQTDVYDSYDSYDGFDS
ncbi:MAG: transglutaminase domain-containing protein [Clostridia bacterium]|nr:transglutaminase domain-containing protein [Clostridia bacterium]